MSLVKRALGMVPVGREGEQPLTPEEEEALRQQEAQRKGMVPLAAVGASIGPLAKSPQAPYEGDGIPMDRRPQMEALATEGSGRNKLEPGGLLDYRPKLVPVGPAGGETGGPRDEFSVADADRVSANVGDYFDVQEEAARRGPMGYQRQMARATAEPINRNKVDRPKWWQRLGNAGGAALMALSRGEGLGGAIGAIPLGLQASRKESAEYGHTGRFGRYGDIMEDEQVAKEAEQRAAEMKPVFQQEEHEAQLDDYAGRANQRTIETIIDENKFKLDFEKAQREGPEKARQVLADYAKTLLQHKMGVPERLAKAVWGPEATEIPAGIDEERWAAAPENGWIYNVKTGEKKDIGASPKPPSKSELDAAIEAELRADPKWGDPEDSAPNPAYDSWIKTNDYQAMEEAIRIPLEQSVKMTPDQKKAFRAEKWAAMSEAEKDAYRQAVKAPPKTIKKRDLPDYEGNRNREKDRRRQKRMEALNTRAPSVSDDDKRAAAKAMTREQAQAEANNTADPAGFMAAWEQYSK